MNLRKFFAELKRRNVYKVAIAYAVVAWLLMQIASQIFPFFEIPNWAVRLVVLLLLIGFPIALVLAWAFELTPEGIKRSNADEAAAAPAPKNRAWIYVVVIGAALSIGLFFLGRYSASTRIGSAQFPEKSIAVLPFENLSEDKANAFFASGIQDEILTSLAKISGLKVISRQSTARYQSSPENLPDIAHALGVAHILEGSVQKAGDRVHINVQLIRADTDAHVWAESYDRALADIFAVEAEVARSVADELRATLSPEEKARVETKPTENSEAYIIYLRANEYDNRPSDLLEEEEKAVDLYTKAIALDPKFALARAALSAVLAHIYLDFQPSDAIANRARSEAEESLRLQPDLGEGHHSRGLCLYWTQKEYDGALRELEIAQRLLPNSADIEADSAYIRRRQGRWRDALAMLKRALSHDPQNAAIAHEYWRTLCNVRDWPAAATAAEYAVAVASDFPLIRVDTGYLGVWSKGDLSPLRGALAAIPAGVDPDGRVTDARCDAALLARDFVAAEQAVANCRTEMFLSKFGGTPTSKTYLLGCIALAQGETERAKPLFESARQKFEDEVKAIPTDPFRHAQLAVLFAYIGRQEDALREARRAIELLPESKDAVDGPTFSSVLALVYARTGQPDQAIPLIERLLTIPTASATNATNIILSELRLRWQWDPLRDDPRFQEILARPEPKTIYR